MLEQKLEYTLIIPTLNAECDIEKLLSAYQQQTEVPSQIIVVDSSSEDRTVEIARRFGVQIIVIPRKEFDHGGTRNMAISHVTTPFFVLTTQDAIPKNRNSAEQLLLPLVTNERIALVGGRQVPKEDARPFEQLVREHNYRSDCMEWDKSDIPEMGVRAFLISDVFAAYRTSAFHAVGGFDSPILTNEDMLIAQKMLDSGYKIAYQGTSEVFHSHNLSWGQQYKRNYIVGKTMKRYEQRFCHVSELGTGSALAADVLKGLIKKRNYGECAAFMMDCSARLLGNRIGRLSERTTK